jgi:hypothetical protein
MRMALSRGWYGALDSYLHENLERDMSPADRDHYRYVARYECKLWYNACIARHRRLTRVSAPSTVPPLPYAR